MNLHYETVSPLLKETLQKLAQSRTWEKDFAEAMLLVQRGATIAISISVAVVIALDIAGRI